MILNIIMILLGQRGNDELIDSFELIEVCVTKCYDFGRPYTTDPLDKPNKEISCKSDLSGVITCTEKAMC
jgi:hypothetical protein